MTKSVSILSAVIGSVLLTGCASIQSNDWVEKLNPNQDSRDYQDQLSRSLYATVGIGPSRMEPDASELAGWNQDDRVEPAGQITIGMDVTKHLSIEGHSADLGSAGFSPTGRINYHINGISALVYAGGNRDRYRRQGFNAYGRVGVGFMDNSPIGNVPYAQKNSTHVLFGAGVEYMTPIGLGLRAEGILFDEDAQYAQLAIMYRTGKKKSVSKPRLAAAPKAQPVKRAWPQLTQPALAAAAPPPPMPPMAVADRCAGFSGAFDGVTFHTNSADLTNESTLILDDVVYELKTCKDVQVEITAHTDSTGGEAYNQSLSQRRAQSVVEYLNARGLPNDRVAVTAYGESKPLKPNNTADGRAVNRRVELYAR